MAALTGATLGSYEIVALIGVGGMGEVYRARDTKLGREVAIKVLPAAFAHDSQRLARFSREAHLLAALNDPHIAAIHGLEEANGIHFLVLELVPGETLADRLKRGPLGWREALTICAQIADALTAAHEKGIVHRDLKPSNVTITPDGKVKVLDFGLGKALEEDQPAADLSMSPTIGVGTDAGVILGTAAYMSPEQARGKPVDKRTDIWAFGCVLWEALTGRQAFEGETVSDAIAAIIERDPNWSALPAAVPASIRTLLRRCLQKDARLRLRDIGDARIEIADALASPSQAPTVIDRVARPFAAWLVVASLVAAAALGALAAWIARRPPAAGSELRVTQIARLTHDPGTSEWPTWSPDGTLLAFAANRSGNFEIYTRRVEGGQEIDITNDPGDDFQPAFSPDGKSIAFVSTRSSRTGMIKIGATFGFEFRTLGGDLWIVPALGGRALRLARDANFPAWHPSGARIAYVSGRENRRTILIVPAEGGPPHALLSEEASRWEVVRVQYSPDGRWVSFETETGQVLLLPEGGGEPRPLLAASSHAWGAADDIYYLSRDPQGGTRLQQVGVDGSERRTVGEPRTLGLVTGILRDLAISRDGRQLAFSELEGSLNLTRLPLTRDGGRPAGPEEELNHGQVIDRYSSVSPDGTRIAFASDRMGPEEIWILDGKTGRQDRLVLPGTDLGVNLPFWTPDGQQLAVTRFFANGTRSIWLAGVDGSNAEEIVAPAVGLQGGPFAPDGRSLIYQAPAGADLQMFVVDIATHKTRQLTTSEGGKFYADWSPDGRSIAFVSNASGSIQLWRMPAAGGKEDRLTQGDERIRHAFYSPDGRWIYFQPSHRNIYRLPAEGGAVQQVTSFPDSGLFLEEPALSRDGRYLVYSRSNGGASLWLLGLTQ